MKIIKRFLVVLIVGLVVVSAVATVNASSMTQNFSNSWSVDVGDHNGYSAAMQWEYQPYSAPTSNLDTVELSYVINISGMTEGDDFRYRLSFFTGWSSAAYQFSGDEWFYEVESSELTISRSYLFTSDAELSNWLNPLYGPDGHYYFESRTLSDSHSVSVETKLTYNYSQVPIPGAVWLLGSGLFGLIGIRRRKQA